MIFLSHTRADKPIVDNLANTLRTVFGIEKVFYDSWSIKPGDGIIDKMNDALSSCKYLFFFVSKNSLKSEMVKLEWQNALLMKSAKKDIKFIPVRIDNCQPPAIISQNLYIDLFTDGPEAAVEQMIDSINGVNAYEPLEKFQNIRAFVQNEASKVRIEFRAERYNETHSKYAILVPSSEEELFYSAIGESSWKGGFVKNSELENGQVADIIIISRQAATSPGFPFIVEVSSKNKSDIKILGISHFVSHDRFERIPTVCICSNF